MNNDRPLLSVEGLRTEFRTDEGIITPVDGVSWSVRRGETLALVGESGCGKSVTALSILRLIPDPPGRIAAGAIRFWDQPDQEPIDLTALNDRQMRAIRGNRIAMVFQEPTTSLNPVFTAGEQIVEAIELHQNLRGRAARECAVDALRRMGITEPSERFHQYPHQLSGGMQQRVMIAMALSCNPALLIADEPTTALDVTIQAQILDLLRELQDETNMGLVLITHDLGVVAQTADRVCVMYAGKIVEQAEVAELFDNPLHPYTRALLECMPRMDRVSERFQTIAGSVPVVSAYPSGCRFHPRCALAQQRARQDNRRTTTIPSDDRPVTVLQRCVHDDIAEPGGEPPLEEVRPDHLVACWETSDHAARLE
ncbi:MAG: ABC transporter ATP-binding protein [Planctomycetes bacterium]|nr:ABC transporter ATP-binding protein [Planctomycetota bacterium]